MRRVIASLIVRSVTPPLQPGLGELDWRQLVMMTTLQSPQLLPQVCHLSVNMLQLVCDLQLDSKCLTDSLSNQKKKVGDQVQKKFDQHLKALLVSFQFVFIVFSALLIMLLESLSSC